MRVCLTLEVCTHLSLALDTKAWIAVIIMFVFGAYAFVWATVSTSVRQRAVPKDLQGRIGSVYLISMIGGLVLGQVVGGAIAQRWGVVAPFLVCFRRVWPHTSDRLAPARRHSPRSVINRTR
jgi:predicted MFS family arabinose efflux permease